MTFVISARRLTGVALVSVAMMLGSDIAAFAQSQDGTASGEARSSGYNRHRARHTYRRDGYRPLTVSRRVPAPSLPMVVRAPYNRYVGPGAIVTAPIGFASDLVALPFRGLNAAFPADAAPPVNFIGAPIAAAGEIAQLPFRIIEAPFGGPAL